MKKVISIALVLAMAVSFTACGKEKAVNTANDSSKAITTRFNYDVFPNTDWGMTIDEVKTTLKLDEKDCVKLPTPLSAEDDYISKNGYGFKVKQDFLESQATITFVFLDKYIERDYRNFENVGLVKVDVEFDDKANGKQIQSNLDKNLENYSVKRDVTDNAVMGNVVGKSYACQATPSTIDDEKTKEKVLKSIEAPNGKGALWSEVPFTTILSCTVPDGEYAKQIKIQYNGIISACINSIV